MSYFAVSLQRITGCSLTLAWCLLVCACVRAQSAAPLQTGWHDELNTTAAQDWTWQPPQGRADLSAPSVGLLRLSLGANAQEDHIGKETYYWATCARYAVVDLDRYPILAVRVLDVKGGRNTWWDVTANEYLGGENHGPDIGATLKPGTKPGLLFFDLTAGSKLAGKKRIRIRLNVAGLERGGYADYSYVRFIRREDRKRLEKNPDLQKVAP